MTLLGLNFDANASYGLLPEVVGALSTFIAQQQYNPSSLHQGGQRARFIIEEVRRTLRELLDIPDKAQIIFTSGATEANCLAIYGFLQRHPSAIFYSSAIEHASVLQTAESVRNDGRDVKILKVSSDGVVALEDMTDGSGRLSLFSVMAANNETGVIQPLDQLRNLLKKDSIFWHCDCSQVIGKEPFSFLDLGADLVTISGHKFGSLTGVGALIVREGLDICPMITGGPQEGYRRAGTENVAGILSLRIALQSSLPNLQTTRKQTESVRHYLKSGLRKIANEKVHFWAENASVLANTLSVGLHGFLADDIVAALDLRGIYVSSGAACSSGKPLPSHVLLAMGASEQQARETIRISLRRETTIEQVDILLNNLKDICQF